MSNTEIIKKMIPDYKKQKNDYQKKQEAYQEAYKEWNKEVETYSVRTDKAVALELELDRTTAELEKSRDEYNILAHMIMGYILTVDTNSFRF